jgi:DNA-binding NtrC family response regulator
MDDSEFMLTVLVVDDERPMLDALARMLRARGLNVETCRNGNEAVELLRHRSVDAVLTDVVMDGLVGTGLLREIRSCPEGTYIPVVFMSHMPERRVRGAIEGNYAFIRKPFDFDKLMQVIDDATADLAQGALVPAAMHADAVDAHAH